MYDEITGAIIVNLIRLIAVSFLQICFLLGFDSYTFVFQQELI